MPHRLPVGKSFQYGPDTITQRPELAIKLAQINDNWNQLEWSMANFYAYLMGTDFPRVDGFEPPRHPIALQIFYELETYRPKQMLFEALLDWRLQNSKRFWLRVYYRWVKRRHLTVANKARNKFVHARWGVSHDYTDALIFAPIFGHNEVWRLSDFEQELKKVVQAKALLGKFEVKVRKLLG